MNIKITKTHGTKNSFMITYNNKNHKLIKSHIKKICKQFDTDGFLLISDYKGYDYKMDYFNNDGTWETMCANGARCAALFMWKQKKCTKIINFITGDGAHSVKIKNEELIALEMKTPICKTEEICPNGYSGKFIDSGAKHFVTVVNEINFDIVKKEGYKIRNNKIFKPDGVNVNFIKINNKNNINVYTYEKGIEDMVMSCGSGSVAAAFYANQKNKLNSPVEIEVPGGKLLLKFNKDWSKTWLIGSAVILNQYEIKLN